MALYEKRRCNDLYNDRTEEYSKAKEMGEVIYVRESSCKYLKQLIEKDSAKILFLARLYYESDYKKSVI